MARKLYRLAWKRVGVAFYHVKRQGLNQFTYSSVVRKINRLSQF